MSKEGQEHLHLTTKIVSKHVQIAKPRLHIIWNTKKTIFSARHSHGGAQRHTKSDPKCCWKSPKPILHGISSLTSVFYSISSLRKVVLDSQVAYVSKSFQVLVLHMPHHEILKDVPNGLHVFCSNYQDILASKGGHGENFHRAAFMVNLGTQWQPKMVPEASPDHALETPRSWKIRSGMRRHAKPTFCAWDLSGDLQFSGLGHRKWDPGYI